MGNIYIAINGDDVGNRIGEAIANDDHEGLSQASSAIQGAHDNIDQWVDSIGGKKISSAGDDAIYLVPEQAVNDLDGVREQYKQESGHGLTVGVGPSMSQASKALIYGKLNGKDQTIHYEPGIEDYLSEDGEQGDEEQPEVPEQADVQGQADADMEAEEGTGDLEEPPVDEQSSQDNEAAPAAQPGKKAPPPTTDQSQLDAQPEVGNEDDVAEDDQNQTDAPGNPVANQTSAQKKASKPVGGNTPPIDGKTDEDLGTGEEDDSQADPMAQDDGSGAPEGDDTDMSETHPGTQDDPDAEADVENANPDPTSELQAGKTPVDPNADPDQESQDPDADGGMDMSTTEGDVDGDESAYQDLSDDDVEQDDDQAPGDEDPLASMIHGDMQEGGDDEAQDPNAMGDDQGGDDSSLDDELRQDIASALVSFKENKDMLEQAREQNPELYNATLTMLRSMIAMAKKLGFAPEQDMADQSNVQQLEEEFPGADPDAQADEDGQMEDDASVDGDSDVEADGTDESPAEKKGANPPAKK